MLDVLGGKSQFNSLRILGPLFFPLRDKVDRKHLANEDDPGYIYAGGTQIKDHFNSENNRGSK